MPNLERKRIAHLCRLAAHGFMRSLQTRLSRRDMTTFGQWVFLRILWE